MSNFPGELKYAASHEWVRDNEDGTITVGISDHAQEMLGDLVFVELPDVGAEFAPGDGIVVAESVKAASDIYAPMAGEVVAVNEALIDSPELVNSDPYGDGWLFNLKVEDMDMLAALMDADTYSEGLEEDDA